MHVVLGVAQETQHRQAQAIDEFAQLIGRNGARIDPHADQADLQAPRVALFGQFVQEGARGVDVEDAGLQGLGFTLGSRASPVVAVRIEDRETALRWWPQLLEQGIYVNLVVPPASPSAFSLLRCSVSAAHSDDQVDRIIAAFATLRTGA